MHVSTDPKLRNQEENNFLKMTNKTAIDVVNNIVKAQTGVSVEPMKGMFLMVIPSINYKELTNKVIM